ncbi:HlyC/CorC family transporter [Flexibacterium corallicola]|uniref:HlyC/CorC family transporter n=1 Tax=Flexibacterium corallicola TaxID=3037259 RepID=UPI00286F000D|nr:HlyC/CorC family transporter [Pseudovibrio sp. M1P-2-3]
MTEFPLWLSIGFIFFLLFLSGFFSGSETALTAASRARMHQLEKAGNKRALVVSKLIAARERLIGALLLGNNLVNILASAMATSLLLDLFGDAGVAYATLIMTLMVLIFSEVLPKTWAITHADNFALAVAPILKPLVSVLSPFVSAIQFLVRALLWCVGVKIDGSQAVLSAHDELRGTVDLQHKEGGLIKADRDRIGGLLDLAELEVSDVMVHRTKLVAINGGLPAEEIVQEVLSSPYTRIPVWKDNPDNFIGLLHVKNVLRALAAVKGDFEKFDLSEVIAPLWFVPDTTSLQGQLNAFLKRKSHFALAVDEYGEVMGLITLEDILEEIVGEIADEHDIDLPGLIPQADGSVIIEGSIPIRDLNRATDWDLPDEEATTIAGLVIHEARMIPEERQVFTFHGFRFTVLQREKNRITRLRVLPLTSTKRKVRQSTSQ